MMEKLEPRKTLILNKLSELAKPILQKELRVYFNSPSEPFVDQLRGMVKAKYIKVQKGYMLTGGLISLTSKGHVAVVRKTNIDHEDAELTRLLHTTAFKN